MLDCFVVQDYANIGNLKRAALLGISICVMSIPRISEAGLPLSTYLPAAFLAMTLVSAAATAWGGKSGLRGLFPPSNYMTWGLIAALFFGLCALPLKVYLTDPILKTNLPPRMHALSFPTSAIGVAGIILWAAGFENMFFNVAATSYFTRLSHNMWLAIALSASFRTFVSSRLLLSAGLESPLLLCLNALSCLIACILFAKSGLPSALLFSAITASSVAFS
jgi:hypothetical protein